MADRKLTVPCMCAGTCSVLSVVEWDDDEFGPVTASLYEHVQCQPKIKDRFRVAWAVLRGREPYTHGLMLSEGHAHELGAFLSSVRSPSPSVSGGGEQ